MKGQVAIPETDQIVITIITDNLADATRQDDRIAKRHTYRTHPLECVMHAEHGLAYHIEAVGGGESHCCLFDFGSEARGVVRNLELLQIDLSKVEALGLSHDHWDHEAAFLDVLRAKKDQFAKNLPLYVGEGFFAGTYSKRNDGDIAQVNLLERAAIEALGFVRIVNVSEPTPIVPGAFLLGRIEQVTDYEKMPARFLAKDGDNFVQEQFLCEQAVIMNLRGKGLVVLSGCSHRGIVNAVKHAQKMTGIDRVHAIVGGFHLTGAPPERIQKTIAAIKEIHPDYIVPTHCTGFEAIAAFAREMPDQFILNTAGTKYTMSA